MYAKNIPLLISFPRSGSHWIQAMAELYFDQPRGPNQNGGWTYRPKKEHEKYMWWHYHDKKLNISPSNSKEGDIFLYRNPFNTIYSITQLSNNKSVVSNIKYYKNLFEKWISLSKTNLIYEKAVENPLMCLRIMSKHFNIDFNIEIAKIAVEKCTTNNMFNDLPNTKFHNKNLLTKEYAKNREIFKDKHYHDIKDIVLTEKTKPFLIRYFHI